MGNTIIAILLMLLSSAMYALSYVLQHKGTQQAIGEGVAGKDGQPPGPAQLIKNTIWLAGVVLFILSFLVHMCALAFGSVAVVQPLLVTELIFIPPLAALISHAKISKRDWMAIIVLAVSLAVFLIVARPTDGTKEPSNGVWILTFVLFWILCFALMAIGHRLPVNPRAALYGTATGVIGALMALLAKGAFGEKITIESLVTNWLTYATWFVAVSSIVLTAVAFRAGPITTSSPAIIVANPVAATLAAIVLFGDSINDAWWALVIIAICVVAMLWGIITLTKSEAVHAALEDSVEDEIAEA